MQTNNHRHCLSQLRPPSCCRCWCMHLAVIYDSCLFQRNFIYLWCVRVYVWFLTWHATQEKRTAKLNTNSSFSANSFFVPSLLYLRDCGKPWQAVVKKILVIKLCFFLLSLLFRQFFVCALVVLDKIHFLCRLVYLFSQHNRKRQVYAPNEKSFHNDDDTTKNHHQTNNYYEQMPGK